jgi:hypothetical protein
VFNLFKKSGSLVASLIVVAAVLPMVLVATLSEDLRLRSFASQVPQLRIWTDPEAVVARTGKSFLLKVYGETNGANDLVPQVKLSVRAPDGVTVGPTEVEYTTPFNGQVLLGEVKVKVERAGSFVLEIPEGGVFSQLPNLQVVTHGTKIDAHD